MTTDNYPYILCHQADAGGCGHYRVLWPAKALLDTRQFHGIITDKLMMEENLCHMRPEICLLQRQYYDYQIKSMRMYRRHIPYMIYELDDILDKVPGWSIHHHQMPENVVAMLKQAFLLVDRVTTTTPFLADELRRFNKHVDIHVLPNFLPPAWKSLRPYDNQGKIRVGWAGALAHKNDLEILLPVMRHFGDQIDWVFMGYAPENIPANCHVTYVPGVALANYPLAINKLNLDVGLAPLEVNTLNKCKSGIRVMELGINGCAMVTTDLEPYQGFENITRIKNTPNEWIEAIELYIKNRYLAKLHGMKLREEILQNHLLMDHLPQVAEAWNLNTYHPIGQGVENLASIVIPVQKNAELVEKCLKSVIDSIPKNKTPVELIIVNDAADTEVRQVVDKFKPHIKEIISHLTVKGFSNSINDGIKKSSGDPIILNSDCVVHNNWIDKLKGTAYSMENFASVTPLGTDDSYVSVNLPGISSEELDRFSEKSFNGKIMEIGTPVGFCMYLKRAALQSVGLFDAYAFPKIYGEENDWGCRALLFGWKHALASNLVVGHEGNTTIPSEENKKLRQKGLFCVLNRYPFYNNIIKNIESLNLRHIKSDLEISATTKGVPSIVMISHNAGGGIETYLQQIGGKIINEGWDTYVVRPSQQNQMLLTFTRGGIDFKYPEVISSMDGEGVAAFIDMLKRINCKLMVVNSLVQYPHWMDNFIRQVSKQSSIPYDVVIHDMYYWCPQLNMISRDPVTGHEAFCNSNSQKICKKCVQNGSRFGLVDIEEWRMKYGKFLNDSRHIHVTSAIFKDFILTYLPNTKASVKIHVHPESEFVFNQSVGENVAVLGQNILPMKGSILLANLAKNMPNTRFVVFGNLIPPVNLPNVELKGAYANVDELKLKLSNEGCSVALFLSTWPEIFMYSMSDAIKCGLQPIVFDIGVPAERIKTWKIDLGDKFGLILPESLMYGVDTIPVSLITAFIKQVNEFPILNKLVKAVEYSYTTEYFGVSHEVGEKI